MKNVLIVDDHPLIHNGLKTLVQHVLGKCIVHFTYTFLQTVSALKEHPISLMLLDLNIPGSAGKEMIGEFRKIQPGLKILICSGRDEQIHAQHFIQRGANGFLHKGSSRSESEMAVKMVMDNKIYISRTIQDQMIGNIINNHSQPSDPFEALTVREREVLELLMEGLWSKEIASALNIKHSTVGTLKSRIFQKLEVNNILELYRKVEIYRSEV